MADLIGVVDVMMVVVAVLSTLGWYDERTRRVDLEKRLGKYRTSVLLNNAGNMDELAKRGG